MGACTWTEVTLLQKRLGDPGRVKARKLRQMRRGPGTHPQVLGRGQLSCGRRHAGRGVGTGTGTVGRDSWSFGLCSAALWGVMASFAESDPWSPGHRATIRRSSPMPDIVQRSKRFSSSLKANE